MKLAVVLILAAALAFGDAGILIPSNLEQPDAAVLSLEEMWIGIHIDNGDARVEIRQVFLSHQQQVLEGNYLFALSSRATVSDFAVWDDVTRIPGVILERKRAEELYRDIKAQAIDPGLLQMGERGAEEARRSAVFSARIVPIPPYGTKRLEIEYHEIIPVEALKSQFAIPLRPDAYHAQTAGRMRIDFELRSAHPLANVEVVSKTYPLRIGEFTPHLVRGVFAGRNVVFNEDFAVRYAVDAARADRMEVLAHREANEPGFFEASALIAPAPAAAAGGAPRTVVALFDNSLSMQWEKLERNFQALDALLHKLRPSDKFNLLLFNSEVKPFAAAPVAADTATVEKALEFVKASRLRGGTDLERALGAGLDQFSGGESYLVLLSDGDPTRGTIRNAKLAAGYAAKWKQARPRTYVYAVGDDANLPLLKMLARNEGLLEWVRSTEPAEFKLDAFLAKIGQRAIEQLRLGAEPATNFEMVYPLEATTFAGSQASWVGQYKKPLQAAFTMRGAREGQPLEIAAQTALPDLSAEHPQLPRTWARARVDALLEKIERDGEDRATIDEIIRLARKYKFVTPYTSFLAAPRALLRPRLIRPGDPVLRVKTDPAIASVVALFPFGLVKELRYLKEEDTWQTRFLAPVEMNDGTYSVRLILRDRAGHVYRESKTFVIASQPPVVRVRLEKNRFRRGEAVKVRASASRTTRTLYARMYGMAPVSLRWSARDAANTGEFVVPEQLAAGKYVLTVTAEDFAHNIGTQEVALEIVP
ncbi:MAG: VIT domain-containing protein [Bryobacteraceae bacterium]